MPVKIKLNQSQIINTLKTYKNEHEKDLGLLGLGIFGSAARKEIKPESDIDVVVKLKTPDLFVMSGIKLDLEEIFGVPVDIIRYRENMNSFLKKRIDKEAIYV
ncbi:MAG: nucleotidyltransferase family protein [bacterium]